MPLEINSEYNPSFRIPDFVGECNNLAFLYNICILYKRMDSIKQLFGAGKGRRSRKRSGGNPLDNLKPIQGGEKKETYGGEGDDYVKTIGAVGGFSRDANSAHVSGGNRGKRKSRRSGRKSRRSRRGRSYRK
jgi:hypothetical protein